MREPVAALIGVLIVVAGGAAGCYPPIPEAPPPEPESRWCVYADPARGRRSDNQNLELITDPMTGLWMSGCACYCPEDHAVMVNGVNGMLVPGSDAEAFYVNQVAVLRTAAQIACLQRANEIQMELGTTLEFGVPGAVSCEDAVADEEPLYASECGPGEAQCLGGATGGVGTGGVSTSAEDVTADGSGAGTATDAMTSADTTADGSGGSSGGVLIDERRSR